MRLKEIKGDFSRGYRRLQETALKITGDYKRLLLRLQEITGDSSRNYRRLQEIILTLAARLDKSVKGAPYMGQMN